MINTGTSTSTSHRGKIITDPSGTAVRIDEFGGVDPGALTTLLEAAHQKRPIG